MSFGLRVWDAEGNVTLDNTDNVGRLLRTIVIPQLNGTQAVVVPVPGLDPEKTTYVLTSATHTHLMIEILPGEVRARLLSASASVGTFQPELIIHLILTG